MKHPSVKNHNQVGHLKAVLARRGGGGILNEPISCCLIKASESKYSLDSFILSFTEGSFVVKEVGTASRGLPGDPCDILIGLSRIPLDNICV